MDLLLKIAEFSAGKIDYHQLPEIATEALCANYDSESLRILAGFDKSTVEYEVMFYFKKVLKELKIKLPDVEEAILLLSKDIAGRIISKNISEYDGSKLIEGLLEKWPNGYSNVPNILWSFKCFASEIEDLQFAMEDGKNNYTDFIKVTKLKIIELAERMLE